MGSTFSKAVRPHVHAAASVTAPVPTSELETETHQDSRLPDIDGEHGQVVLNDTLANVATSSTTEHNPLAPADDAHADTMETETNPRQSTDSYSGSAFRGLLELPGDILDYSPPEHMQPPAVAPPPNLPDMPGLRLNCLICSEDLDENTALKPCPRCSNPFCMDCLKEMFVNACTDMTRMPPKCCNQIPLHHARPYLTQEEITMFKAKYEEWSTPHPFYCPVARCSAFIPERLLLQEMMSRKGKQRVDSGVGTPTPAVVTCPSCETDICTTCRNLAHTHTTCDPLEFGIDKKTAELLEIWGYKRCPKCGHGLKKMYGCDHMECRCGAHFCWLCLENDENGCSYGCGVDSSGCEGDSDENDSDEEPDREEDEEQSRPGETGDGAEYPAVAHTIEEAQVAEGTQPAEESITPQPTTRVLNLDGGSSRYWENQDHDFGGEPNGQYYDQSWACDHSFNTALVNLADSLLKAPSATSMECMKCWGAIHPEIKMSRSIDSCGVRSVTYIEGPMSMRGRGPGRRLSRRAGVRAHPYLMRNPFNGQSDTTRASSVPNFTLHSQPTDSVQNKPFSPPAAAGVEQVIDTYGNIITTTETPTPRRRASTDATMLDVHLLDRLEPEWLPATHSAMRIPPVTTIPHQTSPPPIHKHSPISLATNSTPFSLAYQCSNCDILVCSTCKDRALAALEYESE